MWFGKLTTTLIETTQLKGAPALVGKDLLEAMEVAGEFGFHVSVSDEDTSNPDVPSGRVMHQSPPPGTAINPGGEIQVVLSA
jgi:beta-lactam-binding protein with PASTA domain